MKKINKKWIGTVCFAAMMMAAVVGCDKKETAKTENTEAAEVTTEATTEEVTESTAISQRSLSAGEYTDVSGSYTITLSDRKWETIDETLTKTSLSSEFDLIEIENITKESEVKKALKEIPTLKKSFEGYIEKQIEEQKEGLYEDVEVVNKKFVKESDTTGHYYYTFKLDDDVYNYVTFFGTFTNDHVVLVTGYTEGGNKTRKILEECVRSLKLIDQK